ncbi:ATP-binding protein [Pseudomonas aeruginosa]|uniref:ATP-binding protein n=1 Tax=Pseudomonas aeruginosa TaxID=287 RepID=UPI0015E79468|nr:ATP-binding protein [Pseudomonas aeruginosa]
MSGHGGVLARRLLWRGLLFSLCFTVLAGAVQLFFEYRREMREIEARLELIRSGYLASFERSLWDLNQEQLNVQLRGLGDFPDIARVSLQSADFNLLQGDQRPRGMLRVERFPLSYQPPGGERRQLGELEIAIDLAAVYRRLVSGGLASLLWMGSFLCGLAVALSWLFHSLVTRHLWRMSEFAGHIAEGDLQQPLRLDKVDRERDEIDAVAAALEDMRQALRTDRRRRDADRDELRRQVERRTASLRRAKDQAEAADRAKSRFLATMSHEIRTPLNGILGMAELLREASLGERDRQRLRALATAGEGLLAILNEVLHFARLEEAPDVPEAVDFSLRSLLEDVLTLLEPRARENATRLDLWLDPQVHDGHRGAEQFLRQVLTNLLGNAVKFTEAGEVRVRVERLVRSAGSERLRLSVADDGIGIPEEMRERIFERFTQGGDAVTRRYGGTGLGLAISKRLVEALGGRIGVESRVGQGSTFWFEIELALASLSGATPPAASVSALEVLLVEDVALNREVAQGLLERDGHRVMLAEDAGPALALCRQRRFDLILLDMHLPGMAGLELCAGIRRQLDGLNRATPIFAFTASIQPDMVRRYFAAGMQGVLGKPLRMDELRRALGEVGTSVPALAVDAALDRQMLETHRRLLGRHKLAGLLGNLLGSLDEQLPLLAEALDQADLAEAANIAHRLSGSCHSMGLVALGAGLGELEREALGAAGVDPRAWGARLGSLRRAGAEALRRAGFLGEADSAAG